MVVPPRFGGGAAGGLPEAAAPGRPAPRVLHVSQPTTEGVPRVVVDLVRHQRQHGWDVTVACPEDGPLAAEAERAGALVLPWAATRSPGPSVPAEVQRLARLVRHVRPHLVHLHSAKAGLAGRLALRGRLPTVYQPHAWSFLAARGPVRAAATRWERLGLRWTDAVVCVSQAELEQGRQAGLRLGRRAVLVPNGVDTEHFHPADRAAARAELGLGPEPLAVCVGRLSRQKGQDVLLAAWPAVGRAVPGARLVLVGDGPDREALEAAAGQDVTFAGRADPRHWYAAADVVVLPSRWEGMALVPLEAQACGRSVVVTDVAGAREALPPGAAGRVVPVGDAGALAAALVGPLADRSSADRDGQLARTHVVQHHDVRQTADRLLHTYRDLVPPAAGGG